jgi:hypothetical protein
MNTNDQILSRKFSIVYANNPDDITGADVPNDIDWLHEQADAEHTKALHYGEAGVWVASLGHSRYAARYRRIAALLERSLSPNAEAKV